MATIIPEGHNLGCGFHAWGAPNDYARRPPPLYRAEVGGAHTDGRLASSIAANAVVHMPAEAAEQYRMLNEVSRIIASRRNLAELFHDLAERLHHLLDFSYLGVMLYDATQHVMRLHNLEGSPRGSLRP